jgi:hypothetical protein
MRNQLSVYSLTTVVLLTIATPATFAHRFFTNDSGASPLTASRRYRILVRSVEDGQFGSYLPSANNVLACTPQPSDLVAWYRGEGNDNDETGNHNNRVTITARGVPVAGRFTGTYSAGKIGQAMSFDGVSNRFSRWDDPTPSNSIQTGLTLAAWIKPATLSGTQTLISKTPIDGGTSFNLSLEQGRILLQVYESSTVVSSFISADQVVTTGGYQHIAAKFSAESQQTEIFVNGNSVRVVPAPDTAAVRRIQGYFTATWLGARYRGGATPTEFFTGQLDEVQIFNRSLSHSEILSIYGSGSAGLCTNRKISGTAFPGASVRTSDATRTVLANSAGQYEISLERGRSFTISPQFSSHVFSPQTYSIGPDDGDQSGINFTPLPANDNFQNAVLLQGEGGEIVGNNSAATREPAEPLHAGVPGVHSVWYKWRSPRSGRFTFTLGGSSFDTALALYTGTGLANLSPLSSSDDVLNVGTFSRLTVSVTGGTDYWIAVDGKPGSFDRGQFRFLFHPADFVPGNTVSGNITTVGSSRPILGLTIKAETLAGLLLNTTITDINGLYSLSVPSGTGPITISAFDHLRSTAVIFTKVTDTGSVVILDPSQNPTANFIRPSDFNPTTIAGAIKGIANVNGLKMIVSGASLANPVQCLITTDGSLMNAAGYTCPGLPPNATFTLRPSQPGIVFSPDSQSQSTADGNILGVPDFYANATPGFKISGKVTVNGRPLAAATVTIVNPITGPSVESDVNGDYEFANLSHGQAYTVKVIYPGFQFSEFDVVSLQRDEIANFAGITNCSYAVTPLQQNISLDGGFGSFNIQTGAGCQWQATTSSAGYKVVSSPNSGNGMVTYYVEPLGAGTRTGFITVAAQTVTITQAAAENPALSRTRFDFDGDGRSDIAVRRPSDNIWYFLRTTAGYTGFEYGVTGDMLAPADFDGDGKTDVAVFRPSNGTWYIAGSSAGFYLEGWGQTGDLPVPADFDGDGKADVAVYRPSNGTWYLKRSAAGIQVTQFGINGDKPQIGDFDGDRKADLAVVRPAENTWYLLKSTNAFTGFTWGESGDVNVPADYDGDGKTDPAVFRPSNGTWYIAGSLTGFRSQGWGANGDVPVPADYDGDAKTDLAVFRPSNNTWYIFASRDGIRVTQFGATSDTPVHGALIR